MTQRVICLLVFSIGIAMAQPGTVITGGPVNAASYARAGFPNAGIAQGGMFILFGNNLGPAAIVTASSFPIQKNLGGTSVQIKMGGSVFDALMIYSVVSQVAAIVPSSVPTGDGTVTVTFNGQTTAPVPIHVVANAFGIFTRNQSGTGPAIVFNFNSQADQPVNSLIESANPGQVLTIWGTGLSAVSGDEAGGPLPGDLNIPVDVFIGNKPANIMYRGRSGCCAGIDQIVVTVPAGVQGCNVSLAVRVAGVVSNFASIAVAPSGKGCSDPTGLSVADTTAGGGGGGNQGMRTVADIGLARLILTAPGLGTIQSDNGDGAFRRYASTDLLASTRGSLGGFAIGLPSGGSCTAYPFTLDLADPTSAVVPKITDPAPHQGMDAGPALALNGPRGAMQLARRVSNTEPGLEYHNGKLGGSANNLPNYLDPGNYNLNDGSGGPDIGGFQTSLTIPANLPVWNNANALTNISRAQDQKVTWSGGSPNQYVGVFASSADPKLGAGMQIYCTDRGDAGQITIPAWVLSAMPPTGQSQTAFLAAIGFAATAAPVRFQAQGVNFGFFNWAVLQIQVASFQ